MSEKRFCFMRDDDGHVYLIPAHLKEKFMRIEEDAYLQRDFTKFIDQFNQYRVGWSESAYSFTDPKLD